MTEITCEKIKAFIKDEEKGIKDYKEVGLNKLSRDESNHLKFLKGLEKKKCK